VVGKVLGLCTLRKLLELPNQPGQRISQGFEPRICDWKLLSLLLGSPYCGWYCVRQPGLDAMGAQSCSSFDEAWSSFIGWGSLHEEYEKHS
jgi:hypothetical protein